MKIFHEHMTRVFICSVCKARVTNGTLHKREMHKNETVSFSMFWQSKKYFPRLAKSGKPYPSLPTTTLLAYHADSEKKKVSITSDPPINEFTNTVADKATDGPGASIQPSDNHRATSSIDKKAVFRAFANKKRQCFISGLRKINAKKDIDEEIANENERDRKRSAENSLERPFEKRKIDETALNTANAPQSGKFRCDECGKSFHQATNYKLHVEDVHKGRIYKCNGINGCGSKKRKYHAMNMHLRKCGNGRAKYTITYANSFKNVSKSSVKAILLPEQHKIHSTLEPANASILPTKDIEDVNSFAATLRSDPSVSNSVANSATSYLRTNVLSNSDCAENSESTRHLTDASSDPVHAAAEASDSSCTSGFSATPETSECLPQNSPPLNTKETNADNRRNSSFKTENQVDDKKMKTTSGSSNTNKPVAPSKMVTAIAPQKSADEINSQFMLLQLLQ